MNAGVVMSRAGIPPDNPNHPQNPYRLFDRQHFNVVSRRHGANDRLFGLLGGHLFSIRKSASCIARRYCARS